MLSKGLMARTHPNRRDERTRGPCPGHQSGWRDQIKSCIEGRTSSEMVAEMAVGARLVKSISNIPMDWIQDFSRNKPRTVIFTSGDDIEAKQLVIELINSTGFVAIDLGSLVIGGAMHEVGAPLSGLDLHFVRRLR
jgi:predicted dinucleotide-binding enzyme